MRSAARGGRCGSGRPGKRFDRGAVACVPITCKRAASVARARRVPRDPGRTAAGAHRRGGCGDLGRHDPVANGRPTDTHRRQLAECYRACLDATAKAGLSSIAFCCISTGVFGFPQEEAASIAVATVRRWLNEHPDVPMTVVFNVFSETDEHLYRPLLGL